MAEPINIQDMIDGRLDIKSLGEAANGDENTQVVTRLGETYPSAKKAIKLMFENGALPATPFATKVLMTASALTDGKYAMVTDDTIADNNGLYQKTGSVWVKSKYDPVAQSKPYIDSAAAAALTSAKADATAKDEALQKIVLSKVQNVFATKALMVDSALPNNSYAQVTDDTVDLDNGFYQKKSGVWVKTNYTPASVSQLKLATSILDVSAESGNYSLTLAQAAELVPTSLRKRFLTIRFNNTDELTYIQSNTRDDLWVNPRFWIRAKKPTSESRVNYFDSSMIYKGFILGNSSTVILGEDNYCAIIPIIRTYDADGLPQKINIRAYPKELLPTSVGFIDDNGVHLGISPNQKGAINLVIPPTAKYFGINLQWRNEMTGLITNDGNLGIAQKYLSYLPDNVLTQVALSPTPNDGFNKIEYGVESGIYLDYTPIGARAITPYFVDGLNTILGLHIAQIVKSVEVQKGRESLINPLTGKYRKFFISRISKSTDGKSISVYIEAEGVDGAFQVSTPTTATIDEYGYAYLLWSRIVSFDPLKVRLTLDTAKLTNGQTILFARDNAEIHPSIIAKSDRNPDANRGLQITSFENKGLSTVSSNMAHESPVPLTALTNKMVNGFPTLEAVGETGKDFQQTTLVGSKLSTFYGNATFYAQADALYPNNPAVNVMREKSTVNSNAGFAYGSGLLGRNEGQYIHPDICYSPTAVAGYKYWMINSNYPNVIDSLEDDDLFVSNDGVSWKRVRGFYEADNGGIPFKNPEVFWNTNSKNTFLPIPIDATLEFAKESVTETSTVKSFLAHDPAIIAHNDYIIVYKLYNFGFTAPNGPITHKYFVCVRTNNGVDWEIVREDGSTMPYNEVNAKLMFTKTGGVRNHHRFISSATTIVSSELSPQVVKVSDNEWYMYTRNDTDVTPATGQTMNLVRYKGTNPYTFDYANSRQVISKNNSVGGRLWHFGLKYYDGKFYVLTNGFMFTSTNGIDFTTVPYPFFWRGMSTDLYKPAFVVGHDGKVKIAYGIQYKGAAPHAYVPQAGANPYYSPNKMFLNVNLEMTVTSEYASLSDIMTRGTTATPDAYVDFVAMVISQRTQSTGVCLLPCVRALSEVQDIKVSYDDEVYVMAYLTTRHGGKVSLSGAALTIPDAKNT